MAQRPTPIDEQSGWSPAGYHKHLDKAVLSVEQGQWSISVDHRVLLEGSAPSTTEGLDRAERAHELLRELEALGVPRLNLNTLPEPAQPQPAEIDCVLEGWCVVCGSVRGGRVGIPERCYHATAEVVRALGLAQRLRRLW